MMKHTIFSKINPKEYADAAELARIAGETMLSRLELITLKPELIVDVGCGVGVDAGLLKQRYQNANVYAIDISTIDTLSLPFQDHSVDMIFANLILSWCDDWKKVFVEWRRILKPDGLLMFTCLGLDTLKELKNNEIIPSLVDMHEVGDLLTTIKFSDPVMDVEHLTFNYKNPEKLLYELKNSGMIDSGFDEPVLSLTYELIYGHAFGPAITATHTANAEGIVKIPVSHLR